jgi:hypothetical protein
MALHKKRMKRVEKLLTTPTTLYTETGRNCRLTGVILENGPQIEYFNTHLAG